jgi:thiol-disulfide isomerase/thioredoxin
MKVSHVVILAAGLLAASALRTTSADDKNAPALESNKNREAINAMHGKPAPALSLKNWVNSKELKLADLKGKVVVLDFWATWCGPCIASIPHNNELQKKYAGKVVFIGVCAVNGGEKMAETAKDKGMENATALDTGDTIKAYMADSFPDYYIIDQKGNLRWGDVVNGDVEKGIKLLLAEEK